MTVMRRLARWVAIAVAMLVALAIVAVAVLWTWSGLIIDREYPLPASDFRADPAAADLEEGHRLATLRGCYAGCHGKELEGGVFNDDAFIGYIVTPDLTRAFAEMSDAELDTVVRHGLKPDGKSVVMMPSASFHHLSDRDLNDITVFIRSQPGSEGATAVMRPGLMLRLMLVRGLFPTQAANIAANAPWMDAAVAVGDGQQGRYLALTVCAECHGMDLRGFPGFTPSLAATVAYSREDFGRLMKEGTAVGGRDLGLMREVAVGRFRLFTDAELDALYAYLRTLAAQPG